MDAENYLEPLKDCLSELREMWTEWANTDYRNSTTETNELAAIALNNIATYLLVTKIHELDGQAPHA